MPPAQSLKIDVGAVGLLSALWMEPHDALAVCLCTARALHGHRFMAVVAGGLFEWNIATLRFRFPYMEHRYGRLDTRREHTPFSASGKVSTDRAQHLRNVHVATLSRSISGHVAAQAGANKLR
jgi:predicted alpha/beta-hydrolase family hydrolase